MILRQLLNTATAPPDMLKELYSRIALACCYITVSSTTRESAKARDTLSHPTGSLGEPGCDYRLSAKVNRPAELRLP